MKLCGTQRPLRYIRIASPNNYVVFDEILIEYYLHYRISLKEKDMKYLVMGSGRMAIGVVYDLLNQENTDEIFIYRNWQNGIYILR